MGAVTSLSSNALQRTRRECPLHGISDEACIGSRRAAEAKRSALCDKE